MVLEEQIVAWASTRPAWQRYVLRHIARGEYLGTREYDQLVDGILEGRPIQADFGMEHFPETFAGTAAVRLVSIERPNHVNALSSDIPLTFGATGLTVIYGHNGSGKSGYARLLKRIARARHREQVLSDVFRDTNVAQPTATVTVQIGAEAKSLIWPTENPSELQQMLFYDSACGENYIVEESDFPYRPAALFVMDGLIDACVEVRKRIDVELERNSRPIWSSPSVSPELSGTEVARFLGALSVETSVEELDALIEDLGRRKESAEELRQQEATLTLSDPAIEIGRLSRQADKLEAIVLHLQNLEQRLGDDTLGALERLRSEVVSLEEADTKTEEAFEAEPLTGVGTSSWMDLWERARTYSEGSAYRHETFPFVASDSRCVLCQQTLGSEGANRLTRLEKLLGADTQVRVSRARRAFRRQLASITECSTLPSGIEVGLRDLRDQHRELVSAVEKTIRDFEQVRATVIEQDGDVSNLTGWNLGVTAVVSAVQRAAEGTRREAENLADPALTKLRVKHVRLMRTEMELLELIREERGAIVDELARQKEWRRLNALKSAANTGPITRKISEFSADAITEVIRDRFTRETDRLRLERVTIAKTRASRTSLLHQAELVGARQAVALPRVLSEGERTALGVAAFFTEACLDQTGSAVILDDPVTSLDHERRQLVAGRIVELAATRQAIVFTHDLAFVADLRREAEGQNVDLCEGTIERSIGAEQRPGSYKAKHPWNARDVKGRLGDLTEELSRIKRDRVRWEHDRYERETAYWAGMLSQTWERIFSQEIVGQVLAEGKVEVRPAMVRVLAHFSDQDNREFQASYSRVSQWAPRHDKSVLVNYVAPDVVQLEEELTLVKTWFARVRRYKNIK